MEKLQHALEQARKKRSQPAPATVAAPEAPTPAPAAGQDPAVDAAWDSLQMIHPDERALVKKRVFALKSRREASSFDILRTKLQLLMGQYGWKRIAITSPSPSCGKTTMACNLLAGFSRQVELRSILFDFDMRRHGVSDMLDYVPDHSIGSVLSGKVDFADQAVRIRNNAAVSMANRAEPDPAALLLSEQTDRVVSEIEKRYDPDIMLFDLPPLLVSDDARAFLKNVDCALIVVHAGKTKTSQIDQCEKEIAEHTNVAGIVLNQCRYLDETDDYSSYGY